MSQLNMNNKRNKLAYLLSLFMVVTPQLAHSQSLSAQAMPEAKQVMHDHNHASKTYVCPMHPDETSHEAGSRCSICNMFLVETEEEEEEKGKVDHSSHDMSLMSAEDHSGHAAQTATSPADKVFNAAKPVSLNNGDNIKYVCPMHAHIISDVPSTCPICGMNLEKVELSGSGTEIQIEVSGGMQQALALKVALVEKDTLWKFVQTVGQVDYDESQINHLHARVNGWIEKLTITSVGDKITKGQLLYEIYSPELINAQDDFLLAHDTLKRAGNDASYQDLVRKAGLRLELLGFQPQQIKALAKSKKTQYRVPFYAKNDGIVKALNVRDGMYIQPSTEVMSVVDLSKVWVIAEVFENEQSWLAVGQRAEISVPAMGIKGIEGKIDYIYPELDPVTRSLRVRIVVQNSDIELRPNTLAKIGIFGGPNKDVLVIPQEALIQTGKENRVIVKLEDNSFTARKVTVGMLSQGKAEIKEGLEENERVVTSGQFLLDSEASLKGSLMRLSSGHQH
ncbi:efflux RND transporter periplasmic adaptor subunit [Shewanella sp. D64]|uniref:efflux RND transporter periplasmic adaptor subunit n=1 Tax=unclassified Shewanella TaxID=196818 RepID=UPI0022BA70F4|nr:MULTISPECIES: efflux RND transporter periplasmic adaptor subunit [unclassified Shewanella]MEC4727941.1 efflux RND transporter periplasmic adaptor subunit [Shewanella sp. D64]MEC4740087.1 efflux RND transporter periplasmic adaptor subunit [Shewanella sp. E94]WBJ95856.1 efflux RND transporter periplasmic adaptor subunit [Shewanella sp. MTB7]